MLQTKDVSYKTTNLLPLSLLLIIPGSTGPATPGAFLFSSLFCVADAMEKEVELTVRSWSFVIHRPFLHHLPLSAGHTNDDGFNAAAAATAGVQPGLSPCPPHPSTEGQPERRHVQNRIYFCFVF